MCSYLPSMELVYTASAIKASSFSFLRLAKMSFL